MKKLIILPLLLVLFIVNGKATSYSDLIEVDENYINNVFADLNELEAYVVQNEGVTLNELKAIGSSLVSNVEVAGLGSLSGLAMLNGEPPLGIPSFIWGFCLGWVGILIVYLVSEDKEETKKSLIGCVVGGVTWVLVYFVFWGLIFAGAAAAGP